jgi:hypothetical protein
MRRLLLVAALASALAGCGGPSKASKEERAATARWASGLHAWGSHMRGAIDGISLMFGRPADVRGIQAGDRRVGAILARYERTLAGCSDAVHRLGTAPTAQVLARDEALHACKSLEHAASLIRTGIAQFQHGLGPEVLDQTGDPLTAGEDGIRRALLDVSPG